MYAWPVKAECSATIRNAFPHSQLYRFSYSSLPREAHLGDHGEELITTFLGDLFRKTKLRDGQLPIICNVLAQKATIGLLPTSAGKSICYQLASVLTPGITFVVDPIVFLMKDQVLGLSEQYGVTKVAAWHGEAGITRDEQIGELMATNIMIFVAPERFLRPSFRSAMKGLLAGDLYVNYAVIDEAHCVSMWGHDFRPSYLMLERCFRDYCALRGRNPVVVALTGTASQLVLIDLKRELHIEEFEAIIRPRSFDREELTYNIVLCPSGDKREFFKKISRTIGKHLGVHNIRKDAWGVLFANYPKEVWALYNDLAGNANEHVVQLASNQGPKDELPCGLACGGMPKNSPIQKSVWKEYKNRILPHFKRGRVRLLIGNAAIGVGIDNEHLNYVVVYCMPSSLESLGQQWGRAGRRGQRSQCYLIFSDDLPISTDEWLNDPHAKVPERKDDLGAVAYFHSLSFPGEPEDTKGTIEIINQLWRAERDSDGRRLIKEGTAQRTQQYLSFTIMMGIAEDYEVTGMDQATLYHVKLHPVVEESLRTKDEAGIRGHLVRSLQRYLSRYRPFSEDETEADLQARPEERLSAKAVGFLLHFIYSRIAYQRKESIRTMVTFCRDADLSPPAIRRRMKAFFDRNPKFSDRLDAMADRESAVSSVIEVVQLVDGYDDIEHLYWETRRLLDERFRADWAAINLYALMYRERRLTPTAKHLFQQLVTELRTHQSPDARHSFLAGFLDSLAVLDGMLGEKVSETLLPEFMDLLYEQHELESLSVLDKLTCDQAVQELLRGMIAVHQMEELLHVVKHKHGLG